MKSLFIVRHAKAEREGVNLKDFDRALDDSGKMDAAAMAIRILKEIQNPDLFLSSSAKRALQTAEIFADVFKITKQNIRKEKEIYDAFDARDMINLIKSLSDNLNSVFLFGHNPAVSSLANYCTYMPLHDLPTAGIARIEADIVAWSEFDKKNATWTNLWVPKNF